ncbi:MAG: tetratricopeptide repeat protein [Planctomycetota bacterium]|nr:tetratricopeptide repeat protein [Planctomycetota bacterium]
MLRSESQSRIGLLLFALVLVAYLPALQCGFIWDDDDYVIENPVLRTAAGLWQLWTDPSSLPQYYPLVHTMFWIEFQLWGLEPLGYHLVNILLHATSAVLLWRLLTSLTVPGALLIAALFAVHPVQVESVAWVTERKNVLSLLFYLLAAHAWLRWRADGSPRVYGLALLAFLAALLSKTVAGSLPAALLLVVWWQDGRLRRREVLSTLPMFVMALGFGLLTAYLEQAHVKAAGEPWDLSITERVLVAGRAAWFYLAEWVWPFGLCFNYPRWELDTAAFWQYLFPVGALGLIAALWWFRGRIGRGPLVAVLLFGGTLVPALGFFAVYPFRYSFVADHFQYHASIGALVLLVVSGRWLALRLLPDQGQKVLAAGLVVLAGALTFIQCFAYRDQETLWRDTLVHNPTSLLANTNLGKILWDRSQTLAGSEREALMGEAIAHLELCIAMHDYNYEARNVLGVARVQQGDRSAAREQFEQALEIRADYAPAQANLAYVLMEAGDLEEADRLIESALEIDPEVHGTHVVAAMLFARQQRWQKALDQADWVLKRTPDGHDTRQIAVRALLQLGNVEQALGNALMLIGARPDASEPRDLLAQALLRWLRGAPTEEVKPRVAVVLQRAGDAARPSLAQVVRELRAMGEGGLADDIESALQGGSR